MGNDGEMEERERQKKTSPNKFLLRPCLCILFSVSVDAGDNKEEDKQGEEKSKEDEAKPEATDKADGN